MNPFDEVLSERSKLDEDYRAQRLDIERRREEIAIELLKAGYTVASINNMAGTTNPNWVYTACQTRGLPTPGQIRAEAKSRQTGNFLDIAEIDGGFEVTASNGAESATFMWSVEAGAYLVTKHNTQRGSKLADGVKKFGKGILPFPYIKTKKD